MLDIFKRPCTLRSFEKTDFSGMHPRARYSDRTVMLDVQPVTARELITLPEGMRRDKNVKAFGKVEIKTADEVSGTLADRLLYRGQWYECTGADIWGNTPVGQTVAVFGLIPASEIRETEMVPEEEGKEGGEGAP